MSPERDPGSGHNETDGSQSPFEELLQNLAAGESGLGFIYSALALLANAYKLDDAVLVLESDAGRARPQIFRLHGKVIDTDFVVRFGDIPGLYCRPHSVSLDDRLALTDACTRALTLHQVRAVIVPEESAAVVAQSVEPRPLAPHHSDDDESDVDSSPERDAIGRSNRVFLSRVLVLIVIANLVMTIGGMHGDLRFTLGLVLGLFIPGWSVVGFLGLRNFALEFSLSMASSLAIVLIAAQAMTQINFWHLGAFEAGLCCACLVPLVLLSRHRIRQSTGRT